MARVWVESIVQLLLTTKWRFTRITPVTNSFLIIISTFVQCTPDKTCVQRIWLIGVITHLNLVVSTWETFTIWQCTLDKYFCSARLQNCKLMFANEHIVEFILTKRLCSKNPGSSKVQKYLYNNCITVCYVSTKLFITVKLTLYVSFK